MLYEIRKNCLIREEITNLAHKQCNFWSNPAIEDIKNIVKKNSPNPNQIILPKDAESVRDNFHNFLHLKTQMAT
jgi:hypothetical protein